jgi:predicted transcriptional regulator
MDENDELLPLALELMTASTSDDEAAFLAYCQRRLLEERLSMDELKRLVSLLAAFAGNSIVAWAEDTDRDPQQVMHAIGLDIAQGEYRNNNNEDDDD